MVLDFTGDHALQRATMGWQGRIQYATGTARNDLGFNALLIRPDGVVAWVDDQALDLRAFQQAATRWFGSPQK